MTSGLALLALVAAAGTADRTGLAGALALGATSLIWLVFNQPMEGYLLWRLTSSHGLTMADLVGLCGLSLAAWRLRLWRRAR